MRYLSYLIYLALMFLAGTACKATSRKTDPNYNRTLLVLLIIVSAAEGIFIFNYYGDRPSIAALGIAVAALLIFSINQFSIVSGDSMYPYLKEGDFILINKVAYKISEPQYGDVTVRNVEIKESR